MKHSLKLKALSAAIALSLAGCGGDSTTSDNNTTGIGGSGFISSGTITGFGSVYVNGVKFETTGTKFDIEGVNGTQADLAVGMIVKINGTINADGTTGTATGVTFDDELQGPVADVTSIVAGEKTSFTVLGTKVIVDFNTTSFGLDSSLPTTTTFDFASIANNNNVEVSGYFNANKELIATRVELKKVTFDTNSEIEYKGTISNLSGSTFKLGNLTVNASGAEYEDLPNGLENDKLVEVKGTYDAATTTITATKVEAEDDKVSDTDEFEVQGYVTDYVSNGSFKVNNISVNATDAKLIPTALTLANNKLIEVEGSIKDGVLVATEVKLRESETKITAKVISVNATDNTFTINPNPLKSNTITVSIGNETELEDKVNEVENPSISNVTAGTYAEVVGYNLGNNSVFANAVKIDDFKKAEKLALKGTVNSHSSTQITAFGITFNIDTNTKFENANDTVIDYTQFSNLVTNNSTVVKIVDKANDNGEFDGIADQIEISSND